MQNKWLVVREIAALAGLLWLSAEDLCRKEISLLPVIGMAAIGAGCSLLGGDWTDVSVLLRFLPGLLVLLLARLTDESIGYGDGWVLLALGCFLDPEDLVSLCMAAISCAGIAALFLLLVLHRGRHAQIPFVPFLLLGYGIGLVCQFAV
jgi:leader peptidase (prepilin peptidase)/N-methyltransferase